jgi:hypothetical protein
MTTNDIGPINLPPELISVTPRPDGLQFAYRQIGGQEVISVMCDDARVGPVELVLTLTGAQVVAATIGEMLKEICDLRARWEADK